MVASGITQDFQPLPALCVKTIHQGDVAHVTEAFPAITPAGQQLLAAVAARPAMCLLVVAGQWEGRERDTEAALMLDRPGESRCNPEWSC